MHLVGRGTNHFLYKVFSERSRPTNDPPKKVVGQQFPVIFSDFPREIRYLN
jgi:hypothetical protein